MREPAHLSRRAAAVLPFAALVGAAPAAIVAPAIGATDAVLLDLGLRWGAAWDAVVAHDRAWHTTMSDAANHAHEEVADRLYATERRLADEIMATPARSVGDLAVKAEVVARAHDVEERGLEAVEAALEGAWDIERRSALALAADALRLARSAT